MRTFAFFGRPLALPAVETPVRAATRDPSAWHHGAYVTVRLAAPLSALRVHTAGRSYPGRPGSGERGAWILIGDVIKSSGELADSRSLPTRNAKSMVAFTHTSEARLGFGTVLNIGLASAKFGGSGGEFQGEFVAGPPIRFTPLAGKLWHGSAAYA
ncbi:hypothetical protein SNE35_02225 [Paucibacter sp. R3-3]|uniref:Uncharacterized protein n=1 Tax=Roseateles agri TaxID=3098619 RepID=A0ABU5DAK7_9BURK|nr:hypothetical protein [Paucibacter sp. R3-3]MDY0743300.1 hypothetical protein [Paucibacter sp. R3-3]